jgi:hypothetical protein
MNANESRQYPESLPLTEPTDFAPAQVDNTQNCPQFSLSSASEILAVESEQEPENLPSSADSVPVQVGSFQNRPQLFSPSSASDVQLSSPIRISQHMLPLVVRHPELATRLELKRILD